MAAEIVMPKVDMVMETGTFLEWLKQEGDLVSKGDPLFIIGTDKADIEVEAPASGQLANLGAKRDDVVPVSTVIGYIVQPGESVAPKSTTPPSTSPIVPEVITSAPVNSHSEIAPQSQEGIRSTPVARAQAREQGLNLAEIPGSGPRGRIHKADVERYAAAMALETQKQVDQPGRPQEAVTSTSQTALTISQWPAPDATLHVRHREALKGARAIIAERMTLSASTIPHIHLTIQVDMTEVARLRERVNPVLEKTTGRKASYTAILARALAHLLPQHPYLNSSLVDIGGNQAAGQEIICWEEVNLGIATNQGGHLVVPVLRDAQTMNLEKIVQGMARLLELTQNRKLPPSELKGSTFTITNLGMFGVSSFTPIINPPEAAILAVGQIQETPVARNGEVVIRPLLSLTLAADHRIVDGAAVATFLADFKQLVENPYLLI